MRRVTWLVLIGAVSIGCAKRDDVPLPNVAIDAPDQHVMLVAAEPKSKTFELNYSELWDPKGRDKADPVAAVKTVTAQRYFAKHQTAFLAPSTIGSAVSLAQGGLHGVATPAVLAATYPGVAEKIEKEWPNRITAAATSTLSSPVLDFSVSSTGAPAIRVLVIKIKGGTDDEVRIRFGEYITRLEEAVKQADVGFIAHQRGGIRILGSLSDIRYDRGNRVGYVRSVVVRSYDEKDVEFMTQMLGDAKQTQGGDLFQVIMKGDQGPFLVVSLREERR